MSINIDYHYDALSIILDLSNQFPKEYLYLLAKIQEDELENEDLPDMIALCTDVNNMLYHNNDMEGGYLVRDLQSDLEELAA